MEDAPERDRRLVEAALRGSADAFGSLVSHHQRLVGSIAWRFGVRRDEVEDVVSEVFIKVHANLHRYRPAHGFSTWLYRLAVNHVLDHGRRIRRAPRSTAVSESIPDTAPSAGHQVLEDERASMLRNALTAVDPRYREALTLVYVEGWKVEETARQLGVPEGTIKTRLLRGRSALRKILTERYPGHFEA